LLVSILEREGEGVTDVDGNVGDFGSVIGKVNVVCMSPGMKNRVLYNSRTRRIKVHARRMLHKISTYILKRGVATGIFSWEVIVGGKLETRIVEERMSL
jgi:hypothetical protein